ncbi:MAG: hypothetical protein MK132_02495 [Lentisphaerales bacterium]|nr:hypothetical protein [Lentisphaerales bacterium]
MAEECKVCDSKLTGHESEYPNCGSKLNFTLSVEVTEIANPEATELDATLEAVNPTVSDEKTVIATPEFAKSRALKPGDSLLNMPIGGCVSTNKLAKVVWSVYTLPKT